MRKNAEDFKNLYQLHLGEVPSFFLVDEVSQINSLSEFNFLSDKWYCEKTDALRLIRSIINEFCSQLSLSAGILANDSILKQINYRTFTHLMLAEFFQYFENTVFGHLFVCLGMLQKRIDLFKSLFINNPECKKISGHLENIIKKMIKALDFARSEYKFPLEKLNKEIHELTSEVNRKLIIFVKIYVPESDASFNGLIENALKTCKFLINTASRLKLDLEPVQGGFNSIAHVIKVVEPLGGSKQSRQLQLATVEEINTHSVKLCKEIDLIVAHQNTHFTLIEAYNRNLRDILAFELKALLGVGIKMAADLNREMVGTEKGQELLAREFASRYGRNLPVFSP